MPMFMCLGNQCDRKSLWEIVQQTGAENIVVFGDDLVSMKHRMKMCEQQSMFFCVYLSFPKI